MRRAYLQDEIPPPPPSLVFPLFHPVLPSIEMLLGAFNIFLSNWQTSLKIQYLLTLKISLSCGIRLSNFFSPTSFLTFPAYTTLRPKGAMSQRARALAHSVYAVLGEAVAFSLYL
jgi:hypothetical protein